MSRDLANFMGLGALVILLTMDHPFSYGIAVALIVGFFAVEFIR